MSTAHGFGAPDEGSNISKFEENRTKPERRKFVRRHASSVISSLEKKPCIDFDFAPNARRRILLLPISRQVLIYRNKKYKKIHFLHARFRIRNKKKLRKYAVKGNK